MSLLLDEVRNARHNLYHSLIEHQCFEVIESMVAKIEQSSNANRIAQLQRTAAQFHTSLNQQTENWRLQSHSLEEQSRVLGATVKELTAANTTMASDLDRKSQMVHALKEKEKILIQRSQSLTLSQDISLIPIPALRLLVEMLSAKDLAHGVTACRRWKHVLDRGFIWHSFVTQREAKLLLTQHELDEAELRIQRRISLVLESPKNQPLQREKLYEAALTRIQNQLTQLHSTREDLLSRRAAEKRTQTFLEEQLAQRLHLVGVANLDQGSMERRIHKSDELKAHLAKEASQHERTLKDIAEQSEALVQQSQSQLHELDVKIHALEEVHADGQMYQRRQSESSGHIQEQIKELKAQKKVLVKAVKSLRSELESAASVQDHYAVKVAKLRTQLSQM